MCFGEVLIAFLQTVALLAFLEKVAYVPRPLVFHVPKSGRTRPSARIRPNPPVRPNPAELGFGTAARIRPNSDLGRPPESGRTQIWDGRPNPAEKVSLLIVHGSK